MITDSYLKISGVQSTVGQVVDIDTWAKQHPLPHAKKPGESLTGTDIRQIIGIEGKSWEPEKFRDPNLLVNMARNSLDMARLKPSELEAVIIVTGTPYNLMFDLDTMDLMQRLGLPDHLTPIQMNAGCGGFARAFNLANRLRSRHTLVICYQLTSAYAEGNGLERYRHNPHHPYAKHLWMSPTLFSDGAATVVLTQTETQQGHCFYSRDSQSFGPERDSLGSPLVHFLGGGAYQVGGEHDTELQCYGMEGEAIRTYYLEGMFLNHQQLQELNPTYLKQIKRLYTHQASPRLVHSFLEAFIQQTQADRNLFCTSVQNMGNISAASTLHLLAEDVRQGNVRHGDLIGFSVVGAGPERGGILTQITLSD
ncbi:MAG: hypothetical protein OXT67_04435 [Zetaproteobacteria bacterium]|nr:hypothetical protein [Zetaproteobacteria bacterium]